MADVGPERLLKHHLAAGGGVVQLQVQLVWVID